MFARSLSRSVFAARPAFTPRRYSGGEASNPGSKNKLLLSFASPYQIIVNNEEIDSVTVPAEEGRFGIYPDHVPAISQLSPGVVEVTQNKQTKKYFVGAGFVGVHANSTCHISVTEAFAVEDIDKAEAQQGLEEAKRDLATAATEKAKVENRIRVETFERIIAEV
mmetsp:Transcript_128344/g.191270  ORF Transcript_128344/g.191270 Transcript_128344/m.191270 type:complete len:165 (-) Transcript_128344:113-607(-)